MNIRSVFLLCSLGVTIHAMENTESRMQACFIARDQSKRTVLLRKEIIKFVPVESILQEGDSTQISCSEISKEGFDLLQSLLTMLSANNDHDKSNIQELLLQTPVNVVDSVQKQCDRWNIPLEEINFDAQYLGSLFKRIPSKNIIAEKTDPRDSAEAQLTEALKIRSGNTLNQNIPGVSIQDIKISQDSSCFAVVDCVNMPRLWNRDATTYTNIGKEPYLGYSVDMTPDMLTVVCATTYNMIVWQRDNLQDKGKITKINYAKNVVIPAKCIIKPSQNGLYITLGLGYPSPDNDSSVLLAWKVDSGRIVQAFSRDQMDYNDNTFCVSNDGERLYTRSKQDLLILNVADGSRYGLGTGGNNDLLSCIKLLTNNQYVLAADVQGGLAVYSYKGTLLDKQEMIHKQGNIAIACGHNDPSLFATGSGNDTQIKVWKFDPLSNNIVLSNTLDNKNMVYNLAFGWGDKLLFSAGGNSDASTFAVSVMAPTKDEILHSWQGANDMYISDDNSLLVITLYLNGALVLDSSAINEAFKLPTLLRAKLLHMLAKTSGASVSTIVNSLIETIEKSGYPVDAIKKLCATSTSDTSVWPSCNLV